MLQNALLQQEWRVTDIHHCLIKYLRPHISHPYKNVRDRLGRLVFCVLSLTILNLPVSILVGAMLKACLCHGLKPIVCSLWSIFNFETFPCLLHNGNSQIESNLMGLYPLKSSFSERGHIEFQIEGNEKYVNRQAKRKAMHKIIPQHIYKGLKQLFVVNWCLP